MLNFKWTVLSVLLVAAACAAASTERHALGDFVHVHGQTADTLAAAEVHEFVLGERAHADTPHAIVIALRGKNTEELHRLVRATTDPNSEHYGRRFSREELAARFAPAAEDYAALTEYVAMGGDSLEVEVPATGDVMIVRGRVGDLEELCRVTFHHFAHASGFTVVRAVEGHAMFPARVAEAVHVVSGISGFPPKRRRADAFGRAKEGDLEAGVFAGDVLDDVAYEVEGGLGQAEFAILFAASADESLTLLFSFQCVDGSQPTDPYTPCAGKGTVEGVTITFGGVQPNVTLTTPFSKDDSPVVCVPQENMLQCVAKVEADNFEVMEVSGVAHFEVGDVDNVAPPAVGAASPFALPQDLRKMYRIPGNLRVRNNRTSNAVVEFSYQSFNPDDLATFLAAMGAPETTVHVHEPNKPDQPGGEGSLDIQYIAALAPGAENWYWGVDPNLGDGWMLAYTTTVAQASDETVPLMHSISWGSDEAMTGSAYLTAVNDQLAKMALRGITVFVSSGDNGIGGPGANCSDFTVSFPAELPYVVSVGATQRSTQTMPLCGQPVYGTNEFICDEEGEITCSTSTGALITSGGGFSQLVARGDWQADAVAGYLAQSSKLPPSGAFNAAGRAYPDVATLGHNYPIRLGGDWTVVDGTSASSPVMAAMATLWLDWHLNMHHKAFGWFTPMLYRMAEFDSHTFNDVVMGDNRCGERGVCCPAGFDAAVGYDAVTGLGSPDWTAVWGLMHEETLMHHMMHFEAELDAVSGTAEAALSEALNATMAAVDAADEAEAALDKSDAAEATAEAAHDAAQAAQSKASDAVGTATEAEAVAKAAEKDVKDVSGSSTSSDAKAGVGLGAVALVLALIALYMAVKSGKAQQGRSGLHEPLGA